MEDVGQNRVLSNEALYFSEKFILRKQDGFHVEEDQEAVRCIHTSSKSGAL